VYEKYDVGAEYVGAEYVVVGAEYVVGAVYVVVGAVYVVGYPLVVR
jgi:hypothetical protein